MRAAGNGKNLKDQKTSKFRNLLTNFFFPLLPGPTNTYVKMILMVTLLSTAVEKTTKINHPDLQNGPTKNGAFGRIVSFLK